MINFYDFEVFKYDWLVVLIEPYRETMTVIVNNKQQLESYYNKHKNDIWVGYNSRHYDVYILQAILCGFDPFDVTDFIIRQKRGGWEYSTLFRNYPLNNYDVAKLTDGGLKTLESYMCNDICETSVPFDIDRKLTPAEISETVKYCTHDVEQTIDVFIRRKSDFDAHMSLINTFGLKLSDISKTQAQLSALILGCERPAFDRGDEWDIQIVPTLKLNKYAFVRDWFLSNKDYSKSLTVDICGVPHVFGWGGLHGAREKYHGKGLLLHVDVNSYYPSLMIEYDLLTRNCKNPNRYREIYEKRLSLKRAGKKAEQAPYKIILNATFGITKDVMSTAYDPRQANNICINGQLLLLDLIEKLEGHCELIQSNTDGLIVKIPDTQTAFDKIDDICHEWETRTRMGLGFDIISEIYQGDVNNYVFQFADIPENGKNRGKYERKGAYVQELNPLKNDLVIVNTAIVNYLTKKIPVETTVNSCTDYGAFQKVVKISNKYLCGWHNGRRLNDKTFRVFASRNPRDGYIGKQKSAGATVEKFANTPACCYIENGDINGVEIPNKLDRQYYIDMAKKRLFEKFNVRS